MRPEPAQMRDRGGKLELHDMTRTRKKYEEQERKYRQRLAIVGFVAMVSGLVCAIYKYWELTR